MDACDASLSAGNMERWLRWLQYKHFVVHLCGCPCGQGRCNMLCTHTMSGGDMHRHLLLYMSTREPWRAAGPVRSGDMHRGDVAAGTWDSGWAAGVQAEKVKHLEEVKGVREAHAREVGSLRAELNQQQERERARQDDSCRVHDELLAVRSELAQARAESERTYHEQLVPAQVPRPLLPLVCMAYALFS